MRAMRNLMNKTVTFVLAGLVTAPWAATYRFQGVLTEPDGDPLIGTLYLGVRERACSNILTCPLLNYYASAGTTLGSAGEFDFSVADPSPAGGYNETFHFLYYPTGTSPSYNYLAHSMFQISTGGSGFTIPNGVHAENIYAIPGDLAFCGIHAAVTPPGGTIKTDWTGALGACPGAPELLSTRVQNKFMHGNLVSNGGFENNHGNTGAEQAWEYESWDVQPILSAGGSIRLAPGSLKPRTGLKMARISFTAPASGSTEKSYLASGKFPVKPNTEYVMVFYYAAKDPVNWSLDGVRPKIVGYSDLGGTSATLLTGATGNAYTENSNWTRYFHKFKTGSDAAYAEVHLARVNAYSVGGKFYFDDLVVVPRADLDLANMTESDAAQQAYRFFGSTEFANGIHVPIQTRIEGEDATVFSHTDYDHMHKPEKQYLPVALSTPSTLSNGYLPDAATQAVTLYDGSSDEYPAAGGYPYARTFSEPSPLGRETEATSPGIYWQPGYGHTIRYFYSTTADLNPGSDTPAEASPSTAKYDYRLTTGKNGELAREFKDKFGRLVRKSIKVDGTWINTDYEYDPNGKLLHTLSPPGPGAFQQKTRTYVTTLGATTVDSSGDYGKITFLYDAHNRLRFSQSPAQREASPQRFNYTLYDDQDRVIEKGEFVGNSFTQHNANNPLFPVRYHPAKRIRVRNYYDSVPEPTRDCFEIETEFPFVIGSGHHANFNAAYGAAETEVWSVEWPTPKVDFYQVMTSGSTVVTPAPGTYTALIGDGGNDTLGFRLRAYPAYQHGEADNDQPLPILLPGPAPKWAHQKGKLVKSVTCNESLRSTPAGMRAIVKMFNYDKFGNLSESYMYNGYLADTADKWQKTTMRYNAQNQLIRKDRHYGLEDSSILASLRYEYDREGRLERVRNAVGTTVVQNFYDDLGNLERREVGPTGDEIATEYTNHLHGWPLSIETRDENNTLLYKQVMHYESANNATWDGNIGQYFQTLVAADGEFGYYFAYDEAGRLVAASTENGLPNTDSAWTWVYHPNGAIDVMSRDGETFAYHYNSNLNQLNRVEHSGSPSRDASLANNFLYDAGGQMIRDSSKALRVHYDPAQDRPYKLEILDGSGDPTGSWYMAYDEGGNRVSKMFYDAEGSRSRHYFEGGVELRNISGTAGAERIDPVDGHGQIVRTNPTTEVYEMYVKNHQGSTMKTMRGTSERYRTDYEPFGKLRGETGTDRFRQTSKFTGKELDSALNLAYFGARYYDPDFGIWISPDPADQYHVAYDYCGSDPVNCLDSDGRSGWSFAGLDLGDKEQMQGFQNTIGKGLGVPLAAGIVIGTGYVAAPALGSYAFGTAPNAALFYSGTGTGGVAAVMKFASSMGKQTIEMTRGGKVLHALDLYNRIGKTVADAIWRPASAAFAKNASGQVTTYLRNPNPIGIFKTVEEPILKAAQQTGKVTEIIAR